MVSVTNLDRFRRIRHDHELEYTGKGWEAHHSELSRFILPRKSRFVTSDRNTGTKKHQDIVDPVATFAARTLSSGMTTGITSPTRPWFRVSLPNRAATQSHKVRTWLHDVAQIMRDQMLKSNLYTVLPSVYEDLGVFGTSCFLLLEDDEDVFRAYHFAIGQYQLSNNARLVVDCMSRKFSMTVRQVVEQFGIDNVSPDTKLKFEDQEKNDEWLDVVQVIAPNEDFNLQGFTKMTMPWVSVYYEESGDAQNTALNDERILSMEGFNEFPIMAPRWTTTGEDVYGGSPGIDVLGDVKGLQFLQIQKAQAFEKQVKPPMQGPPSLRGKKTSILPGDVTFVDATTDRGGFRPSHEVRFDVAGVLEDIREHEGRVNRAFYVDLFLSLLTTDRRFMTATEVEERREEKLLMLGPVLERLNNELLEPMIDRIFNIMNRRGLFPEPPEEISGQELKIEYVSILATAQKIVGIGSIERLFGFAAQVATMDQAVLDKIRFDRGIDEMHELLDADPSVLRTDEEVEAIRAQRAEFAAQQAAIEQMGQTAAIAKDLAGAQVGDTNALEEVVTGGQVPG